MGNDDIELLTVGVRADTAGFARDVVAMRESLTPLTQGAERAGRSIEASLLRATKGGRSGFDDLGKAALSVLESIAASALKAGIGALVGSGGGGRSGGSIASVLSGLFGGAPGRATGGPVSPGRAYVVGERGPELFVPTRAGRSTLAARGAAATCASRSRSMPSPGRRRGRCSSRAARSRARCVRRWPTDPPPSPRT